MKKNLRSWSLMKKIGRGTLFGISVVIFVGTIYSAVASFFLPEPYQVEIPKFAGQILPAEKVHPGTFRVEVGFSKISQWGEGSILSFGTGPTDTYGTHIGSYVLIEAWNPI